MAGRFRRVGASGFPGDPRVRCGIYEWSYGDPKKHRAFRIRFLSPDDEPGPRVYYVEPLLRLWLAGRPTRFLEKASSNGYRVLTQLEPSSADDQDVCKLCLALFRNRHEGHARVGRLFNDARDFVTVGPNGTTSLITPGLGVDEGSVGFEEEDTFRDKADKLLRSALRGSGVTPRRSRPRFSDVLSAYEHLLQQEDDRRNLGKVPRTSASFPLNTLPGRSTLDLIFTDGLARNGAPWGCTKAIAKVASALIHGPVSKDEQARAVQDPELFKNFARKIGRAASSKSAHKFDRWLATVRSHGYLSLVQGTRLEGEAREKALLQAQRMYCNLLWMAYERMARCYGSLMVLVYTDFCLHADHEPTAEEQWRFRQLHFPQLYLAGLPLDFLDKQQFRWVIRGLQKFWGEGVIEPRHYDTFTELLGFYGILVRERREADRKQKRDHKRRGAVDRYVATVDPHLLVETTAEEKVAPLTVGGQEAVKQLTTADCPSCGKRLRWSGKPPEILEPTRVLVELYCDSCDDTDVYLVDPHQLARDTAPQCKPAAFSEGRRARPFKELTKFRPRSPLFARLSPVRQNG